MTDWARAVREVVDEARRKAGSGSALAGLLATAGVGPENGQYSESGISNWAKGRAMPPADVLLAVAAVGEISLDQKLRAARADEPGTAQPADVAQLAEQVEDLRRLYAQLDAALTDLYTRTGQPYPSRRAGERDRTPDGR